MTKEMLERYEKARQNCLRYANLHPTDKSRCADALQSVKTLPALTFHLADLLDDMALALGFQGEPTAPPCARCDDPAHYGHMPHTASCLAVK